MSGQRRNQPKRGRRQGRKPQPVDLWRPVGDPTALLRSLGEPPLQGSGARAEITIATVVDRAAGLATALAAAGGLLDEPDAEGD
jgi:hypothetical protein